MDDLAAGPAVAEHDPLYPWWSALKAYGVASGGVPSVGACVQAEGTIGRIGGASVLAPATLTSLPASACNVDTITPYAVLVGEIASDNDINSPGYQPGQFAEPFESVLVRLSSLVALTANDMQGDFTVGDGPSGPNAYLFVANDLYQVNVSQGNAILSLTGILDEADNSGGTFYRLLPRSGADVVK